MEGKQDNEKTDFEELQPDPELVCKTLEEETDAGQPETNRHIFESLSEGVLLLLPVAVGIFGVATGKLA